MIESIAGEPIKSEVAFDLKDDKVKFLTEHFRSKATTLTSVQDTLGSSIPGVFAIILGPKALSSTSSARLV